MSFLHPLSVHLTEQIEIHLIKGISPHWHTSKSISSSGTFCETWPSQTAVKICVQAVALFTGICTDWSDSLCHCERSGFTFSALYSRQGKINIIRHKNISDFFLLSRKENCPGIFFTVSQPGEGQLVLWPAGGQTHRPLFWWQRRWMQVRVYVV